jgi:hypothetical protein
VKTEFQKRSFKIIGANKWGQININFQSKVIKAKGGFLMVEYHKSFSPP